MIETLVLFQICSLKEEIRINPDGSPTIVYQQGCERVEVINFNHYHTIISWYKHSNFEIHRR